MIFICFVWFKFCYCFAIAVFVIVGMEMERKGLRGRFIFQILLQFYIQQIESYLKSCHSVWHGNSRPEKGLILNFPNPSPNAFHQKKLRSNNLIMFYYRKLLFFHKVGVLCTPKRCWSCWLVLFLFNVSLFSKTIGFQVTPLWYKRFRIVRV